MSPWETYYEATKNRKPRPLVVEAVGFVTNKQKALDLGAGALIDSRHLLEQGFEVTAVDADPAIKKYGQALAEQNPKLTLIQSTFEKFDFKPSTYDCIVSINALPFVTSIPMSEIIKKIIESLAPNGIFAGTFFGINDSWNISESKITFVTHEELLEAFKNQKLIKIAEEESDKPSATGPMKHWHILKIIVQKI